MSRRVSAGVLLAVALAGCGSHAGSRRTAARSPTAAPAPTVTIAQIEKQNARARRRETRRKRAQATPTPRPSVAKPAMTDALIPFPASRRREMAAYSLRHYGSASFRLVHPRVIVEHYTVTDDAASAIDLFRPDHPDPELHELPNVCSHFVIDRDGTIYRVVPTSIRCRHTVGLNDTAIGIEHAGLTAAEVLGDRAQMRSSLHLTRWLQCHFGISVSDVIGHNESLSSPYHHENVAALRSQTHQDWNADEMRIYRGRLARLPSC